MIKLLSKEVVEKIAAGEVVERPASVVKELLENSLDAGATRIEINFEGSGVTNISISDNGTGMSEEELKLAFKRHATSKISNIDDLNNISTLGFRGEALPSIAAVSCVTVSSRIPESDHAHTYKISGGEAPAMEIAARAPGTTVKVENIFFNVPVRKKFLKAEVTERRNIIATVESLALTRADVAFILKSGAKKIFDFSPSSSKERFLHVFGRKLKDLIIKLEFENPFIKISGFITKAETSFIDRKKMHIFINNRPVYSPLIMHAISRGCNAFIPQGRYPACMLNIGIKPELVDVNIHPSKKEVRFVNQQGIHEILSKVITSELSRTSMKMDITLPDKREYTTPAKRPGVFKVKDSQLHYLKDIDLTRLTEFSFAGQKEEKQDEPAGKIIPRFQWKNKYIIAEDDKGILVIDQHTAWERINYERLKSQFKKESISSQGTLIPEVLELESSFSEVLISKLELLKKFGIYIEEFGPNTFKVTGIPSTIGKRRINDMIENIISLFEARGTPPDTDELNDELIKIIACRSSIMAGDKMSGEEVTSMIAMLNECLVPHRCPHGRPVTIRITESELDSKFMR